MDAPFLPWSGRLLQFFCRIYALYLSISTSTKKPVRLLMIFNAVLQPGKVIIADLKVYIRKSPVVGGEFQIVGVVVENR